MIALQERGSSPSSADANLPTDACFAAFTMHNSGRVARAFVDRAGAAIHTLREIALDVNFIYD
jgi:hypothetical protein